MDEYGWRDATEAEVEALIRDMGLVGVYHTVADLLVVLPPGRGEELQELYGLYGLRAALGPVAGANG